LASANKLVQAASQFEDHVVLRDKIYRIAMNEAQADRFQKTAVELPEFATWMEPDSSTTGSGDDGDAWETQYFSNEENVVGALKLSGGCKVLHMQSYLKGLWSKCESIGSGTKKWMTYDDIDDIDSNDWKERLAAYDCVVFAAGSGLFQSSVLDQNEFPITLVRGQSIEMTMNDDQIVHNAILCGKYVSPLPENRVIIGTLKCFETLWPASVNANLVLTNTPCAFTGATHEFKAEPLTPHEVELELKERSYHFASGSWDHGTIDNVTVGYRVQSNRGPNGRMPIVGKLESSHHHNSWVFTGLSGRGILYHGIYGDLLSNLILEKTTDASGLLESLNWWRK
jgi:glycine/D-amino acid oxidase-like deaminating enzyme